MCLSVWGAVMCSLILLIISNVFTLNSNQKKAVKDIDVSYKAAKIITLSAKFFLAKKNYYVTMLKLHPE